MLLLFSGGLDSYIAWEYLNRPKTLYVALGHRYQDLELERVRELIPDTVVDDRLHLGDLEEEDAHIPLRNAFLALVGSLYDDEVALVVQKGEMDVPDRSPEFFHRMTRLLATLKAPRGVRFFTPFWNWTKTQMVQWYLEAGHDPARLLRTRSCYTPTATGRPCGHCAACFRRWVALTNNGLQEEYENDPLTWEGVARYVARMKQGDYDPVRTRETLAALRRAGYPGI